MGPSQHAANHRLDQGTSAPRTRVCLLKGCEHSFQPHYPFTRYCSFACLAAAQRWSEQTSVVCSICARRAAQRKANCKYRGTEHGKACRRQQSRRYRERCRERQSQPPNFADFPPEWEGEGYIPHQQVRDDEKIFCHRPGCYVRFQPPPCSPLKKFCSAACRRAFRRVAVRDQRWMERLGKRVRWRGDQDEFW